MVRIERPLGTFYCHFAQRDFYCLLAFGEEMWEYSSPGTYVFFSQSVRIRSRFWTTYVHILGTRFHLFGWKDFLIFKKLGNVVSWWKNWDGYKYETWSTYKILDGFYTEAIHAVSLILEERDFVVKKIGKWELRWKYERSEDIFWGMQSLVTL